MTNLTKTGDYMKTRKRISIKYYTDDKYMLISDSNLILYDAYLHANFVSNSDTFETSYKLYQRNFMYFLIFLAEHYDNLGLYSNEFMKNAPDIVTNYMHFCRQTLKNNKKTINNKVGAITSFYNWSCKTGKIEHNPLANKITRMSRANEETIIKSHFLTQEQMDTISAHLIDGGDERFDFQDTLLWFIFIDSANRLGAIEQLNISDLSESRKAFVGVREKEARLVDVAFSDQTLQLILWWLDQRREGYDFLTEDALFINFYGGRWKRMTARTIQNRIRKIGTIVGIEDLHPHSIRKSTASNMLDQGADSYLISQYLNHKSMEVLKNYIKPKTATDIYAQIQKQISKNVNEE